MVRSPFRLVGIALIFLLPSCGPFPPRITAGGATFVDPIMQKWAGEYRSAHNVEIDYIKKGSGYGIRQMTEQMLQFGCTDAPMNAKELEAAHKIGGAVIHIPLALGAVCVVYNLPEITEPLKLSGDVLGNIFLRKITQWNDEAIAQLNPGVNLPNEPIVPVTRAESSGTTYNFTEFLHAACKGYPKDMLNKKPRWPDGVIAQEGSDGVTGHIKSNRYCIGYVEALFARRNDLSIARVQNAKGNFILPESKNVSLALHETLLAYKPSAKSSKPDLTYVLANAPGAESYPISAISYAILYRKQNPKDGPIIVNFLKWATREGQQYSTELEYAPLPESLVKLIHAKLDTVIFE